MDTTTRPPRPSDRRSSRSLSPLREFLWLTATTAGLGTLVIVATSLLGESHPLNDGTVAASSVGSFFIPAKDQSGSSGKAPARTLSASEALDALRKEARGKVTVTEDASTASRSFVRVTHGGDLHPTFQPENKTGREASVDTATAKVTSFLSLHGAVFGIQQASTQLVLVDARQDQYGHTRVSFQQMHHGLPVLGAVLRGHVSADGRLTAVSGKFVPSIHVSTRAQISRAAAVRTAVASVAARQSSTRRSGALSVKSTSLMIYRTNLTRGDAGTNRLVYEVQVSDGHTVREVVYVDARSGKILDQVPGISGAGDGDTALSVARHSPPWRRGVGGQVASGPFSFL
jgi:hypothetical protein